MKKLCVVTGSRAEYGLLLPLIKKLLAHTEFELKLAVTGSHLSPQFGNTYELIEKDEIRIDKKIEILLCSDTPSSISKSMGLALIGFGDYFSEISPDLVIVLGDRFEILAAVSSAVVAGIPVAHLHGGEVTEGAIDEYFRHAITKLSTLHFASCEEHRKRIIQMGENPEYVYNVGAIGIENIVNTKLQSIEELEQSIGFTLDLPFALITFNPVTSEKLTSYDQFLQVLTAIEEMKQMKFIFTKANADEGGNKINKKIDQFIAKYPDRAIAFTSMGQMRYLSAMKYCSIVIGNSSSGIIETPSFNVPTINIGNRQKGRIQATSVINCEARKESIMNAVDLALSPAFQANLQNTINPYGIGNVSGPIVEKLELFFSKGGKETKKAFFDLSS